MASTKTSLGGLRGLPARLGLAFGLVALGSGALAGVPLYVIASRLLERSLGQRLEGAAELAAIGFPTTGALELEPGDEDGDVWRDLRSELEQVREEADLLDAFIVDRDGALRVGLLPGESIGSRPSFLERDATTLERAFAEDSAHSPLHTGDDGESVLYAYAPIDTDGNGEIDALLGVAAPAAFRNEMHALRLLFGLAGAAWVAGVSVLGVIATRGTVVRVRRLLEAVSLIEQGKEPPLLSRAGVAELDALQDAFRTMATAVRQREAWLRSLAGTVAHEVRNPASSLRLQIGLLRRDLATSGDPGASLARFSGIENDLDLLEDTVASFLAFANHGSVRRRTSSLRGILERAAAPDGVDSPDAEVAVDPLLLEQAVANLVRNARQAGGAPVQVRAAIREHRLRIQVEDRGPGFPPAILPRAFEPFVSGRPDGSGLGLAVVAAIARAHGGDARILRSGPGAIVEIDLPIEPSAG